MEVKKFLRNKSIYILLIIIFISFLLINLNVVYFGDDYYYLIMSKENGRLLLKLLFSHYLHANGRLIVHTLVCLFLKMPMIYWQILNSAMLTGICYFGTKVIIPKEKIHSFPLGMAIIFSLIASLNILIIRESVYWLTGIVYCELMIINTLF